VIGEERVKGVEGAKAEGEKGEEFQGNPFCGGKTLCDGEDEKKTFFLRVPDQKGFPPGSLPPKNLARVAFDGGEMAIVLLNETH